MTEEEMRFALVRELLSIYGTDPEQMIQIVEQLVQYIRFGVPKA